MCICSYLELTQCLQLSLVAAINTTFTNIAGVLLPAGTVLSLGIAQHHRLGGSQGELRVEGKKHKRAIGSMSLTPNSFVDVS